jgi:endonuclease/exonuclease/phosphatase family metal-dependent hydrolase
VRKALLSQLLIFIAAMAAPCLQAQILFSSGTYTQNFDSLATNGTSNAWSDNGTIPGWYAANKAGGTNVTNYRAEAGTGTTGALYSYGNTNSTERALGTLATGTPQSIAFGVCFTNDGTLARTNITISYTGEQWRTASTNAQRLSFAYRIANIVTNADAGNTQGWVAYTNLDFVSPTFGTTNSLDGNNPTNQVVFSNVLLPGVTVLPGQEMFFRWLDVDDTGSDHGLAVDNVTISSTSIFIDVRPPIITAGPTNSTTVAGTPVSLSVTVDGGLPMSYQWQLNGTNLSGATLSQYNIAAAGYLDAGTYSVIASNQFGTASASATLTVVRSLTNSYAFSLMTYNVKGNGATDWTTNATQVQAIGRQVAYLQPDIITFNEIPNTLTSEMTNFIKAYLPGYFMATNSGTDNFIRSVIASRYPITRSSKWLDGANLDPFGYTNANFTRDLFEAQVSVPLMARPLHVFVTHLKSSSGGYTDAANKRAAEAAAITNFFATNFFVLYPNDPFTLSGDMNEADTNTLAIQTLCSPLLGTQLQNPKNPVTGSINTYSAQASLSERIDYIFPCALLATNVATNFVFRSDFVPLNSGVLTNDSKTASDHLPVLTYFANPYQGAYRFINPGVNAQTLTLNWSGVVGAQYRLDTSTNFINWSPVRTNLATNTTVSFSTNMSSSARFYRLYRLP